MTPTEMEAMIRKAFVDGKADCIVITSRREQTQILTVNYGITQGWLDAEWDTSDEQSTAYVARLTPLGRKYFGFDVVDLAW